MKKAGKIIIPLLIVLLFLTLPVQAGGIKKIAQTGMKWLSIPVGARAAALGGAYTAVVNDASAVFWNPAGIAFVEGKHIFLSQNQWIADITLNSGSLVYNAGNIGAFGVSVSSVDWGVLHGTRRSINSSGFEETGEFSPTDWAVGLSYARRVSNQFAFGGHIKYLHENLGSTLEGTMDDPKKYTAEMNLFAFDFGTIFYTGYKDLRFGMSLKNFSQEKEYRAESFPLPLTFTFGLAMDMTKLWTEQQNHTVTLSVDAIHPRDYTERIQTGCEYSYKNLVFLRGGYKLNYDEEDFTLGGGFLFEINNLKAGFDYSYLQFKNFSAVNMFSFDFKF
ncbi:MAG TPA: PorV/PorQ family protein [bacterium]|nr:PorV/PorQ family protein [bacterium]HPN43576.1 PorV/PorQ family protein [bacterium]